MRSAGVESQRRPCDSMTSNATRKRAAATAGGGALAGVRASRVVNETAVKEKPFLTSSVIDRPTSVPKLLGRIKTRIKVSQQLQLSGAAGARARTPLANAFHAAAVSPRAAGSDSEQGNSTPRAYH